MTGFNPLAMDTIADADPVQPWAFETVTVYVPAELTDIVGVVCPPDHK